jgi:hypothetical protein
MHNLKIFSAIAIVAITAVSSKAVGAVAIVGTGNALVLNDTSKDAVLGEPKSFESGFCGCDVRWRCQYTKKWRDEFGWLKSPPSAEVPLALG